MSSVESKKYSSQITDLINEAAKLYAAKDFDLASAKYGEACELYSSENDDGAEDIDLLFLYGSALFQSGVSKSEAFGGAGTGVGAGAGSEPGASAGTGGVNEDDEDEEQGESNNFQFNETLAEEEEEEGAEIPTEQDTIAAAEEDSEKPTEQEEDDSENEEVEEQEPEEEEQTDFELAWDILDLTRSLIEDKIATFDENEIPKETPFMTESSSKPTEYVQLLEKLSKTYDLLGEVSLEAENFQQASKDLSKSLELRLKLYPSTSQQISESHYKLSLAFEFCIDESDSRHKAAEQMKAALEIVKKQADKDEELIQDLEVRYADLLKDPAEELQKEKENIIKGILGEKTEEDAPGASASASASATQTAASAPAPAVNDLTNMIVKKKRKPENNKKTPGMKKQKQ